MGSRRTPESPPTTVGGLCRRWPDADRTRLAVEVEQTLKRVFLPLGARVSELYGGFELTVADKLLIEKTQILVATPEKLDALFRFTPELVGALKLVILDEGHIISPTTDYLTLRKARGLKYEVFLVRLVARFESTDTRASCFSRP